MPSCLWFLINICPGAQEERMNWLLWAQSPRRSRNLNLLHLKDSCSWGPSYPGICSCICYHPCCWKGGSSDRGCGGGAASWKAEKRGSPAEANVAKFKCCRNLPRRWSCPTVQQMQWKEGNGRAFWWFWGQFKDIGEEEEQQGWWTGEKDFLCWLLIFEHRGSEVWGKTATSSWFLQSNAKSRKRSREKAGRKQGKS